MTEGDQSHAELPDVLADRAAEQLLAATGPVRHRVLAVLVAEHPQHAASLRQLAADLGGAEGLLDSTYPTDKDEAATDIGGHRVIRRLGAGAFGMVFLCAQETPVVRQVAIKVLRPGAGDQKTLRRFAAERQLLAALNHPAITQVFDADELPDGRPFFVMEYVDGVPIRSYCEARQLPCRDRLHLFIELCRGVAHAHKRGIVHRDLKPANVLVVDTDNGPMPKIIDFGIAKALFASDDAAGPRTDAGRVIGTPGYMSPEQAAGRNAEVDERADIFALGVMLYELLTGVLPWTQGASATDTEPVRPSARVTTSTSATIAMPSSQRRQLVAELRGDLDWITLKALARERSERYATVTDLLADVERHLQGKPVSVGPPSTTYRLRKFVRRNRALVATIGGAALILGIGLGMALHYGRAAGTEVADAKKAAAASFADATAVVARLLARATDPQLREAPQSDGARRALLQDALSFYDRFLQDRPTDPGLRAGRCNALLAISQVHLLLGETTHAASGAEEAVAEAEALHAAAPESIVNRGLLGEALRKQGRAFALAGNHAAAHPKLAAAATHLAACAAIAPATYGRSYAAVLGEAANTLEDHPGEGSLAGMRQSLQVLDALRADHPQIAELADDHAQARVTLATQLTDLRRYDEAKALLALAESDLPRVSTDRGRLTTLIRRQQGRCAWSLNNRPMAIQYMQAAVEAADAWLLEQPQRLQPQEYLARASRDLGIFQNYVGAFAESDAAFRRAIAQADAMVLRFPEDPSRLAGLCSSLRGFAQVLWDRFRRVDLDEAATCAARATAVNERIAPTVDVGRQPRWLLLAMEAGIAESLGKDAGACWRTVEADLPADARTRERLDQDLLALVCCSLARWHLAAGECTMAARNLVFAREAIERNKPVSDKLLVEAGWLEAKLAAARGDHAATAAAADQILAARSTWYACRRAGDCLHLAWQCVGAAPGVDASTAASYCDRAVEQYGNVMDTLRDDVAKDPQDPWYVLPWGFACVRTAELAAAAGDAAKARELLGDALPKLEAVRAAAHVDQWEEQIVEHGRVLQGRLAVGNERR